MPALPRKPWFSDRCVERILELGAEGLPKEVCGLIAPDQEVIVVPNTTPDDPTNSYVIMDLDLADAIDSWCQKAGVDPKILSRSHFIIWHTHPSGHIGPSRGDMLNRLEGFQYGVVTLPSGPATLF